MTAPDYQNGRLAYLRLARFIILSNAQTAWPVCMQHDADRTKAIVSLCHQAAGQMATCLDGALLRIEEGVPLEQHCDWQSLPDVKTPCFSDTASGGAASALHDAALLVVTLDPEPFASRASGDLHEDVLSYLNGTLHIWLLQLQRQWNIIQPKPEVAGTIFDTPIPSHEREKATLGTCFKALCHSWNIGAAKPSPYKSDVAPVFAEIFRIKLWPYHEQTKGRQSTSEAKSGSCLMHEISASFQEWYFSVGKTQVADSSRHAANEAAGVFSDLRDQFHQHSRECRQGGSNCLTECIPASFAKVKGSPFTDRCRKAVDHILLQIRSPG